VQRHLLVAFAACFLRLEAADFWVGVQLQLCAGLLDYDAELLVALNILQQLSCELSVVPQWPLSQCVL
jgi:hypothetical protein